MMRGELDGHGEGFLSGALLARFGLLAAAVVLLATGGCAYLYYQQTEAGVLDGTLVVEWYPPDRFLFIPDLDDPLVFTRSNGERIQPGLLYTDGSRIPRALWVRKHYSPWGYTPAFMLHDWLFEMHHCGYQGHQRHDPDSAATVLSEAMKTLMQDPLYGGRNEYVLYDLYHAVRSPAARRLWREGRCDSPLRYVVGEPFLESPIARYVISF